MNEYEPHGSTQGDDGHEDEKHAPMVSSIDLGPGDRRRASRGFEIRPSARDVFIDWMERHFG